MWQHFQIISSAISWLLFIVVASSEGAVVINMFVHASFINPQCVCFIQTKPNALGHLVLLWGMDTIMALVFAAGGLLPILHYQLIAMGCESGHGAALLVAARPPCSTAVGTQGFVSDRIVELAVMCIAIKATSFPQGC